MRKILKCLGCDIYTMEEKCTKCGSKTFDTKPAKFKMDEKYSKYRRIYKEELKNAVDI
ncbi:ribosome biogenesis protein [Candidatus Woesearchaeota archaeon]|nr:ribosome biogenesis protein [Candidatus Woesearchaeota archaeon]